ncbi:calcium-binding and coiled-coil domain-containing protein 2 isoform X2 [Hydra vulgaris]|uniref:Calcium-binding and coiled-coil domain-containing protein 2 isoform X2 n=1 Tax=Hydra vulgaris TaxID=6087 RepID=A0ABM4CTH1_HYDVU
MSNIEEYLETLSNYEEDNCVVVFKNLKGVYSSSQNLPCEFILNEILSVDQCRLSIFSVGWNNFESSIASKDLVNLESNVTSNGVYSCEFDQTELPGSNYDEFYQFCLYNYKSKTVYGASCPFQINDNIEDFENVHSIGDENKIFNTSFKNMNWWTEQQQSLEFSNDTVLVHNKTTMLEAALAKLEEENDKLKCKNDCLKKELDKFQKQLTEVESLWRDSNLNKVNLLQGNIDNLLEENKKMKLKLSEYENLIENQAKQIDDLEKNKLSVKKYETMLSDQNQLLSKLKQEKFDLKSQLDYASERIMRYENMLKIQNNDMVQKLEFKLKQLEFDNKKIQSELGLLIEDRSIQVKVVNSLKAENEKNLKIRDNEIALLCEENKKLKHDVEKLNSDKLLLLKSCDDVKEDYKLQVKSSIETSKLEKEKEIRELNEKIYEKETRLVCLMENEKLFKEEIKNLKTAIEEEQISAKQTKELLNELQKKSGPEAICHSANICFKKELVKANKESKHYQKLYLETQAQIKDLSKLNDELKYRLGVGKKAFENEYSQCQKLKKELLELKKVQTQTSIKDDAIFENEAKLKILALQEDLERTRKSEMQLRIEYQKLYDDIQIHKKANSQKGQSDIFGMIGAELPTIYFPPSASNSSFPNLYPQNKPRILYPPNMDKINRDLQISPKKISNEPEVQIMH